MFNHRHFLLLSFVFVIISFVKSANGRLNKILIGLQISINDYFCKKKYEFSNWFSSFYAGGCCQTIKFENAGMADFYYPELMGSYGQISQLNGKPVYQQINGNAYLYWLSIGSWTVSFLNHIRLSYKSKKPIKYGNIELWKWILTKRRNSGRSWNILFFIKEIGIKGHNVNVCWICIIYQSSWRRFLFDVMMFISVWCLWC